VKVNGGSGTHGRLHELLHCAAAAYCLQVVNSAAGPKSVGKDGQRSLNQLSNSVACLVRCSQEVEAKAFTRTRQLGLTAL
jgi:hypothetical protein